VHVRLSHHGVCFDETFVDTRGSVVANRAQLRFAIHQNMTPCIPASRMSRHSDCRSLHRLLGTLMMFVVSGAFAQGATELGRNHARSVVASQQGIVATSQVIASQVGAEILARGGSAADAAIAANLVLGVVEPMMSGPGGDLFALHRDAASGEITGLNASGWSPAGLDIEVLKKKGLSEMPRQGIDAVTVPGAVAGWAQLHARFGKLPWKALFAPAIRIATDGFAVSELISVDWKDALEPSCRDESCRSVLLPGGTAPAFGTIFRNPGMARALQLIADKGPAELYKGSVASAILATSARLGGTLAAADLSEYEVEWVKPISTTYRGWAVYQLPPNSRGIAVLEALNLFGTKAVPPAGADAFHLRIETMRLADADVALIADPRTNAADGHALLSPDYTSERAQLIDEQRAQCIDKPGKPLLPRSDTTFIAVVDRAGNMVSLIQSLATGESGVLVDGMGFLMQNRGAYFSLDPTEPNALAPRKRSSHTIIPALMEKDDAHIAFGFVGGPTQPIAQLQFISNVVDYGMNLQAALEAPHFDLARGCGIYLEGRVPQTVRDALQAKGHEIKLTRDFDPLMGVGQVVLWDSRTKMKYGASSPRGDGAAVPEPPTW